MKKCFLIGMFLKGWRVSIEKRSVYYLVEAERFGSLESIGGIKTLEEAKRVYRELIEDIRRG